MRFGGSTHALLRCSIPSYAILDWEVFEIRATGLRDITGFKRHLCGVYRNAMFTIVHPVTSKYHYDTSHHFWIIPSSHQPSQIIQFLRFPASAGLLCLGQAPSSADHEFIGEYGLTRIKQLATENTSRLVVFWDTLWLGCCLQILWQLKM